MSQRSTPRSAPGRRCRLAGIVLGTIVTAAVGCGTAWAQGSTPPMEKKLLRRLTVQALKAGPALHEGDWVQTCGFHAADDGGGAL